MSEPYGGYSPQDVIFENLRELEERRALLYEQILAHLCELAAEIDADLSSDSDLSSLPDYSQLLREELASVTDASRESLVFSYTSICVSLCRELYRIRSAIRTLLPDLFLSSAEEEATNAYCRIAYPKSLPADDAFLRFSQILPQARAIETHSFSAVCEELLSGRCEYGILPMESTSEGRLSGVSRLIDRYGLRILLSTRIPTHGENESTHFALLGRESLLSHPTLPTERTHLELSLVSYKEHPIEALLLAARLCGLHLEQMDAATSPDASGQICFHPRFSTENAELMTFLFYLSMELPHCEIVGFFAEV